VRDSGIAKNPAPKTIKTTIPRNQIGGWKVIWWLDNGECMRSSDEGGITSCILLPLVD